MENSTYVEPAAIAMTHISNINTTLPSNGQVAGSPPQSIPTNSDDEPLDRTSSSAGYLKLQEDPIGKSNGWLYCTQAAPSIMNTFAMCSMIKQYSCFNESLIKEMLLWRSIQ